MNTLKRIVVMTMGISIGWANVTPTCDPDTQNCWIKALIAQDPADTSSLQAMQTYVGKIGVLAPALAQLHLRIVGPLSSGPFQPTSGECLQTAPSGNLQAWCQSVNQTAQLIQVVRQQYPDPSFIVGFHPDNSKSSYASWGCNTGDAVCVFSNSIAFMNDVNAQLSQDHPEVTGFNEFSIEQSYVEDVSSLQAIKGEKSCLTGQITPGYCSMAASPAVRYANTPNGCYNDAAAQYMGSLGFDDNFPQMYNLEHDWTYLDHVPFDPSLYDSSTLLAGSTYAVSDANLNCIGEFDHHPYLPGSICPSTNSHGLTTIYQIRQDQNGQSLPLNPQAVAQYLAWLLSHRFVTDSGGTPVPFPCGATEGTQYLTLSGEGEFLGGPQWTLSALIRFHQDLITALKAEGVDTDSISFAIWNYGDMLNQVSLPGSVSQSRKTPE